MGGTSLAVGNLLIARLPANGAGTGNYMAAASFGTPNAGTLGYVDSGNIFGAGNLISFTANHVWYDTALTTEDISNIGRQTGNLTFTKNIISP